MLGKVVKTISLILISIIIIGAGILAFFELYVFKVTPNSGFRSSIPPIDNYCKYQEALDYAKYQDYSSTWEPNNKFGIYVYAEEKDFFELAQNLVNSSGGSWGYVLIPYNVRDRDQSKWDRVFDQLNAKKLIPVVQLWDLDYSDYKKETTEAAEFLNKLKWPIKFRYIAVYNEPNSADFWFGRVAPTEYAKVLDYTITTFKKQNDNFFMMNAGFNTSSPNDAKNMDAFDYMKKMNEEIPGIFSKLDGWASHSYPQPNFSGSPHTTGRWSIRAYDTELAFLKEVLHVDKELPVFITETGWAHAEGEQYNGSYLPVDKIGEYFKAAFEQYWLPDKRVRAVMPFTIWYPKPFDHFSWVNADKVPYAHYNVIKDMKKIKGKPPILKISKLILNVCDVAQ